MDTNTALQIVKFAFEKNGIGQCAGIVWLEWSNRMTKAMGSAIIRKRAAKLDGGPTHIIKLSTKLFARATPEQQRQTVIHEACHIIDSLKNEKPMSHGSTWRACMRACGAAPERCHSVDTTGLTKRHLWVCAKCGQEHQVTPRLHNKMQTRRLGLTGITAYRCGKCKRTALMYNGLTKPD